MPQAHVFPLCVAVVAHGGLRHDARGARPRPTSAARSAGCRPVRQRGSVRAGRRGDRAAAGRADGRCRASLAPAPPRRAVVQKRRGGVAGEIAAMPTAAEAVAADRGLPDSWLGWTACPRACVSVSSWLRSPRARRSSSRVLPCSPRRSSTRLRARPLRRSRAPGCRRSCSSSACVTTPRRARCGRATASSCRRARRGRGDLPRATARSRRKLGAALAAWPGTLDRIEQLGALYPRSSLVQLHVGLARFWAGERARARRVAGGARRPAGHALCRARRRSAPSGLRTGSTALPAGDPARTADRRQARSATARAPPTRRPETSSDSRERARPPALLRPCPPAARQAGVGPPHLFGGGRRDNPNDVEALVADAVGRYSKESPVAAFSRLGPLSRRFPEAATVRFHLGLLLLWQGDVGAARKQLRLARSLAAGVAACGRSWPLPGRARESRDRLTAR